MIGSPDQAVQHETDAKLALMFDQVGAGQLIVYEVPLRTFTAHPNSNVGPGKQGTFLGFLDKVCSLHPAADSMHGRSAAAACQAVQRATPSRISYQHAARGRFRTWWSWA